MKLGMKKEGQIKRGRIIIGVTRVPRRIVTSVRGHVENSQPLKCKEEF